MRFASVDYDKRGTTALITLDEPSKLNALSPGIREGLTAAFAAARADADIRVVVLTGGGKRHSVPAPTSAASSSPPAMPTTSWIGCWTCCACPRPSASR